MQGTVGQIRILGEVALLPEKAEGKVALQIFTHILIETDGRAGAD